MYALPHSLHMCLPAWSCLSLPLTAAPLQDVHGSYEATYGEWRAAKGAADQLQAQLAQATMDKVAEEAAFQMQYPGVAAVAAAAAAAAGEMAASAAVAGGRSRTRSRRR